MEMFCMVMFCRGDVLCGDVWYVRRTVPVLLVYLFLKFNVQSSGTGMF
jgi:hypothetical protein